jgi:hypothetical protein
LAIRRSLPSPLPVWQGLGVGFFFVVRGGGFYFFFEKSCLIQNNVVILQCNTLYLSYEQGAERQFRGRFAGDRHNVPVDRFAVDGRFFLKQEYGTLCLQK